LKKSRYVRRDLEIITITEEFDDHSGLQSTTIFARKNSIIPFLYRTRLVYASKASLQNQAKIRVSAFEKEKGWIDSLDLLYAEAKYDHAMKKEKSPLDRLLAGAKQ
jgi:hypothetical protein